MAALSGLSNNNNNIDASLSLSSSTITSSTLTWSDLFRRQCRVVSSLGRIEARLAIVGATAARVSDGTWIDPHAPTINMTGPEWTTLCKRQQSTLQDICAVRDRMKRASHRLGFTSAAYEESVAHPNLSKRVPSHFNNVQIRDILNRPIHDGDGPIYPLTKLLVLVVIRDLQRFIISGTSTIMNDNTADASTSTVPSSSTPLHDLVSLSLSSLLSRLMRRLCALNMTAIECSRMITDGPNLAILSLKIDKDTRTIMNAEEYHMDPNIDNLKQSDAFIVSERSFHAKQSRSWFTSGISPFADYTFTRPPSLLEGATRIPCAKCKRPSSLYCPFCMIPTLAEEFQIPPVVLPLQVDIIHHVNENVKKSTSIHACILSPSHCRFLEHPHGIPSSYDPLTTLLLYPTSDAIHLDDPRIDLSRIERVIVIEATWSKSDIVAAHPSLAGIRRVKIRDHESTFWRYQELGRNFLSTIEAIYWTNKEFENRRNQTIKSTTSSSSTVAASSSTSPTTPPTSIDDILYFYAFQHSRITARYENGEEAAPRSWSGGAGGGNAGGETKEPKLNGDERGAGKKSKNRH